MSKQKYRLRCLLRVKGLVICFYLGWSGSIIQIRTNMIKVGSKLWLLTCSSDINLSLPSYNVTALQRELNVCNSYLTQSAVILICNMPAQSANLALMSAERAQRNTCCSLIYLLNSNQCLNILKMEISALVLCKKMVIKRNENEHNRVKKQYIS